jgi:RNA polymerase sigma-70 factor (family 1)
LTFNTTNSDKHLLYRLKDEGDTAFLTIYKEYWPRLYTIAFNRLNSKEGAEDVVQEVMASLWQRRAEVNIQNLSAWLSAATRYSVLRQLARQNRAMTEPITAETENGYEQGIDFYFLDKMIKEQIHQLPEKCKLVFEYSRQHGLSNKEIASQLDITEKTVEKHITKALHKLRTKLTKALLFPFFLELFISMMVG